MRSRQASSVPAALEGTRRRFERWRQTRKGRSRIPEHLWASAAKAAGKYGLNRTAQTLRLDYYSLKERVEAGTSDGVATGEAAATFVELTARAPTDPAECIVELEDAEGSKLRIHLKGNHVPDVTALCRTFWNAEA
jgi:hypothetical protein